MSSGRVGQAFVLTSFFTAGYGRHRKLGVGFRTAGYGRHRSQWVNHTNSYAYEHIMEGTHCTYAQPDGSWKEVTSDETKRWIALLIYFGLVRVGTSVDRYWSIKSLYHGLWARSILGRGRYKALMAMIHVVDPAAETPDDKLRKVNTFIDYFKGRCPSLYQPRQKVAIDKHMVKSRHRSGIRRYIKDKPTKWGI